MKYSFFDDVVSALRGSDQEQLQLFRDLAAQAASSSLAPAAAIATAQKIRPEYGRIIQRAAAWGVPNLLVPAISIYIAWMALDEARKSGVELNAALAKQHASDAQVVEELRHISSMLSTSPPPTQRIPSQSTSRWSATGAAPTDRPERRRAEKAARKAAKRNP